MIACTVSYMILPYFLPPNPNAPTGAHVQRTMIVQAQAHHPSRAILDWTLPHWRFQLHTIRPTAKVAHHSIPGQDRPGMAWSSKVEE